MANNYKLALRKYVFCMTMLFVRILLFVFVGGIFLISISDRNSKFYCVLLKFNGLKLRDSVPKKGI